MLLKEKHQAKSRKMLLPALLTLFISLRLLWALWAEQTLAEYLYLLGCFVGFVWMLAYIFLYPNRSYKSLTFVQLLFTVIWCIAMFLGYQIGYHQDTVSFFGFPMDSYARNIVYDFILLLPGIVFADQYRLKIGKLVKIILFALVISSLYITVSAVIKEPDALRMGMSEDFYGELEIFYGLPDYSVIYSLTLIVPWLLYKSSQSAEKNKIYYVVLLVSVIIIIAVSQFATALLAAIVCIVIYFTIYLSKKNPIATLFVVLLCFVIVIGTSSLSAWLNNLSKTVEGSWAEKLKEISLYLEDGESTGDLGTRSEYYTMSLEQFFKSPLLGTITTDVDEIGGHSTFLDILGLCGLFGAIPCIVMIWAYFARLRKFKKELSYRAAVWSALSVYLIFLFMKNIISAISINYTFFVLLPILFFSEESNEQSKEVGL